MISRRTLIIGGSLTIIFSNCKSSFGKDRHNLRGCVIPPNEGHNILANNEIFSFGGNEVPILKTDDVNFNRALSVSLSNISRTFDVLPGFAFFDDTGGRNAYATPYVKLNRNDGTVMFGTRMLKEIMARVEHPTIAVTAVCAHEFGHIVQFKHKLIDLVNAGQPNVKRSELQADYLAGFYSGVKKLEKPSYAAVIFATTQHSYGDFSTNSKDHHGTPDERASAIVAGFKLAYIERKSFDEAIQRSIDYVKKI